MQTPSNAASLREQACARHGSRDYLPVSAASNLVDVVTAECVLVPAKTLLPAWREIVWNDELGTRYHNLMRFEFDIDVFGIGRLEWWFPAVEDERHRVDSSHD